MVLDRHGILSIVQIGIYLLIILTSVLLVVRHGFSKGWIMLLVLAIGMSRRPRIRFKNRSTHPDATIQSALWAASCSSCP